MIEFLPVMLSLLSRYDMFFTERYDKQQELFEANEDQYRKNVKEWLEGLAKEHPKLKNNIPSATKCIIDLISLQQIAEKVGESQDLDETIDLFEKYCRNWRFLEQIGINYLLVTNNFELENDYFKDWELKLYDYYSDLTFMGIMTIAYCSQVELKDDQEEFENLKSITAMLLETERFLKAAKNCASTRESGREEHVKYVDKLQYYLDYEMSAVTTAIAHAALSKGQCTYAAHMYERAMLAEERLAKSERDEARSGYHVFNREYYSAMVDLALGLAWLEKSKGGLRKTKADIPSKSWWTSLKDKLWSGTEPYTLKEIENKLNVEIEGIDGAAAILNTTLDDKVNPSITRPPLENYADELKLPKLNTTPTPLL